MIRIAVLLALVVALVPRAGLVDAQTPTIIAGTVKNKAGKPLPGLALLEKGEIHNNVWDRGTLVDTQGRFRIEVASAGQYGLHVYSSGYIYPRKRSRWRRARRSSSRSCSCPNRRAPIRP